MKGAGYWKERAGQRVTEAERASAPYLRKIAARYREAARSIDRDIRKVLDAYRQDFTRAEAEAFLREEIPMAEYDRLKEILPGIQDERYRKELTMRLNAQSYRYRITRMQYIRQLILARLSEGADYEKRASSELYRETAEEGYLKTLFAIQKGAGVGFSAAMLPEKTIDRMESARLYGRNFSASVWRNRGLVAEAAASVLESGILAGQSIRRMSKELMEQTYTHSVSNAVRLIRTEVNYFCNQGALESYREAEIEEYEFLATLDLRTSAACRELDGKKFPLAKAQPGKNCPPMHPYCRSTVIPIIDTPGLARMEQRAARDTETGKSVQIDDMRYEEWKKHFVRTPLQEERNNGIIQVGNGGEAVAANHIDSPIEQRHTGKGNPNAVLTFGLSLNNRQKRLLEKLPDFGSQAIVAKKSVRMADLAALTAETGVEYAMFTRKGKRLIIRGSVGMVDVTEELAKQLKNAGYRWSGHTHPGADPFCLMPSDGDRLILRCFGQSYSSIYNSKGQKVIFSEEGIV